MNKPTRTQLYHLKQYISLDNVVLAVAALITISWLWGTVAAIQKNYLLAQEAENLNQQIAVQKLRNQNLAFQQKYYQSGEYLELSAREHFNLASPGEKLILLPPTTAKTAVRAPDTTEPAAPRSNFDQWMYFFFGQKDS